jgi:D-sedoheptulose 7-phosphate isomerase
VLTQPVDDTRSTMKHIVREQLGKTLALLEKVMADDALISTVADAAEVTAKAMLDGRKLMVAGNGGSAADSQHLVAEFVSRLVKDRPALRAIALSVDTSILTAVSNDYGYERCFVRQVEALGQKGDVFLGISTSGNSPNVLRALELCRTTEITTIGFSGNGGGKMAPLCDYNVIIPSDITMNIQESHLALEHIFCMLVERCYFGAE